MKRNLTIGLSMLAVFLSGAVVGAFGHRLYAVRTVIAEKGPQTPEQWRSKYVSELRTRLTLDDNQVAKLNTILDETRDRFRAMKERTRPEGEQIKQDQRNQIRAMLNPTQRAEYEQVLLERERKHAQQKR